MKKILSIAAAFVIAAAFISCGGNSDEFDGKTDTVLTIAAPSVKAKAYPGVNYVTWSPVAQATGYDVVRIADGAATGTVIATATTTVAYADVAATTNILADGKTYEYVVIALAGNTNNTSGATVPTRSVYVKANSGKASVKAYVPAAGTEITAFTDSYTKNFLKKYADEKALSKAGAKVTFVNDVLGGGDLYATFPATAGFNFGVKFINKTQPNFIKKSNVATGSGVYLEDYTGNFKQAALGAGEYDAYVTVSSVCGFYPTTVTYSLGTYTIPELKVTTATAIDTAGSKFVSEKKAHIEWAPAVLADGTVAPTTNYKVYRTEGTLDDGKTLVAVTATVASTDKYTNADNNNTDVVVANNTASGKDTITKVYYVEDEVPVAGKYTYFVVNTNGTEFEKIASAAYVSATVGPYATNTTDAPAINGVMISKDKDNLNNVIKVTATKGNSKQKKLTLSYINLDATVTTGSDYVKTFDTSKFTTAEVTTNNDITEESYIFYIEKAAVGTYLLKLTADEDGKASQSKYQIVYVTGNTTVDVTGVTITRNAGLTTDNKALVIDTQVTADTVGLYKYQLVKVETVTPNNTGDYTSYVTVTSTTSDITLKYDTGISAADASDPTKDYAKYGIGVSVVDPAATTPTYKTNNAYVVVSGINGATSTAGKQTSITWSVKKILVSDATVYKYSDNNTNGKVTITY